jgi:hypothetical protein
VDRYFGWLLAARLVVAVVFLLNGLGIIDQTIPAREMLERGRACRNCAQHSNQLNYAPRTD